MYLLYLPFANLPRVKDVYHLPCKLLLNLGEHVYIKVVRINAWH